jgi:hypothetical protein
MGLWDIVQIQTLALDFSFALMNQKPYFTLGLGNLVEESNKTRTNK